jgi:hypothetical protein
MDMARIIKARPTIGPTTMPTILVLALSFFEAAAWDDRVTVEDAVPGKCDDLLEAMDDKLPGVDNDPEENEKGPAVSDSLEENNDRLSTIYDSPFPAVTGGVR